MINNTLTQCKAYYNHNKNSNANFEVQINDKKVTYLNDAYSNDWLFNVIENQLTIFLTQYAINFASK